MKKVYKNPTTKVIKIQTMQMLAVSAKMYGQDATGAGMSPEWFDFDDDYGFGE